MTVPADHVIGATGECQNYQQVLSPAQFARWQKAQTAKEPVEIVTLDEAKKLRKLKVARRKHGFLKQITFGILHGDLHANLFGTRCLLMLKERR